MLENYLVVQLQDRQDGTIIVQQGGALPHFEIEVCACVGAVCSYKWTACVAPIP